MIKLLCYKWITSQVLCESPNLIGPDPVEIKKSLKKKHDWTVKRAFTKFVKQYEKGTKHREEVERIFKKDIIPVIGSKPIDEVTKDHILKILDNVMARGSQTMANRTLSRL